MARVPDMTNFCKFRCGFACGPNSNVVASYDDIEWQRMKSKCEEGGKPIPYFSPENTLYIDFFENCLLKNLPCMFSPEVTARWLSRQLWSRPQSGKEDKESLDIVDYEYLRNVYGGASVSAVNCRDTEYLEGYGSSDCREMTFQDYMQYLSKSDTNNYDTTPTDNLDATCLYLKDWHIVRFHKDMFAKETTSDGRSDLYDLLPYECPNYFQSDWLNEYCDDKDIDDYKFCYMGPQGSFTGFHADVYGSYSWSANVSGKKKWYLYPPGKENQFYDARLKKLNFSWDNPGVEGEDYVEVIQSTGECLFVPSGWHHVVWNLTEAVSINHNWFNGANICYIWSVLQNALLEVERELADLRQIPDFHEQCQLVLKANHGMDYQSFFALVQHIQEKRWKHVHEEKNADHDDDDKEINSHRASWHTIFDLKAIHHVIQEHCSQDPIVQKHFSQLLSTLSCEK